MAVGRFIKSVVQRGEAEKNAEKVLTKSNYGGIITELSNESGNQNKRSDKATAKTSSKKLQKILKNLLTKGKRCDIIVRLSRRG